MTSGLEQSLKKRLHLIAKERNITPAQVWQNVIAERFFVRLCRSRFRSNFVLKGGVLLARNIDIGRETKDLDFAVQQMSNEIDVLQNTFNEIVQIQVGDRFVFTNPIVTPLEHFHMSYSGAHVKIEVHFGSSKFYLFIDLGFGDLVRICEKEFLLLSHSKGPLFEASVVLQCYPVEFVFAEKLETVIYRGADNSRMKDFHDLFTLVNSENVLNKRDTIQAIRLVFAHRKTPFRLPIRFDGATMETLQKYWKRYRQIHGAKDLPVEIKTIIERINQIFS